MKKLMFCAMALAAGAVCAENVVGMTPQKEGYPSLMRYFAQGLDGIVDAEDGGTKLKVYTCDDPEFAGAVDEMYEEKVLPIMEALTAAAENGDVDLAYKFQMSLKVVENGGKKQPKLTDFIGDKEVLDVSYFASAKKTITGSVWAKARPSVVGTALLNALIGSSSEFTIAKVPLNISSLGGLITEVRGVGLYDATKKAYLTPSLFGLTGAAMGKDGKEAFGGFITIFGADVQKMAEDAEKFIKRNEDGSVGFNEDQLIEGNLSDYFGEDIGLAIGLGIGKNNVGKKGKSANYIKNLQGTCFYFSTKTDIAFNQSGKLDVQLADLFGKGEKRAEAIQHLLGKGTPGLFYNAYTGAPYPAPFAITIGNGSWKLAVNAGSIKKFANSTTQDDKWKYFLDKTGLPKTKDGTDKKALDVLKAILDAALLGDSADNAIAYFNDRKAELDKFATANPNEKDEADVIKEFFDALIEYCNYAKDLGVADTSTTVGSLNITKLFGGGSSKPSQEDENAAKARELVALIDSAIVELGKYLSGSEPNLDLGRAEEMLDAIRKDLEEAKGLVENSDQSDKLKDELGIDAFEQRVEELAGQIEERKKAQQGTEKEAEWEDSGENF